MKIVGNVGHYLLTGINAIYHRSKSGYTINVRSIDGAMDRCPTLKNITILCNIRVFKCEKNIGIRIKTALNLSKKKTTIDDKSANAKNEYVFSRYSQCIGVISFVLINDEEMSKFEL